MESDTKEKIKIILNEELGHFWELISIFDDIQLLVSHIVSLALQYIPKECKKMAHYLAKRTTIFHTSIRWKNPHPDCIHCWWKIFSTEDVWSLVSYILLCLKEGYCFYLHFEDKKAQKRIYESRVLSSCSFPSSIRKFSSRPCSL